MSDKNNQHQHGNHMWMMLACFLVMGFGIWGVSNSANFSGGNFSWLLFLLCPLMHLFMMKGMCKKDNEDNNDCH